MHPLIFGFPAFIIVLPFAVAVGTALPLSLSARHPAARWEALLALLLALTLIAVAGAKLYSFAERGELGSLNEEIGTGFRYPGGILAVLMAAPLLWALLPIGIPFAALLDCMAPGIGVAMAVMRVHCLLSGCCTGWACAHAWCIPYPHESPPFQHQMIDGLILPSAALSLPVHPLPIYFMVASLIAAGVALWLLPRAQYAGQTFLVFMVLHEGAKFGLEYLRYPAAPLVQSGSLAVALGAIAVLIVVQLRGKAETGGARRHEPREMREGT